MNTSNAPTKPLVELVGVTKRFGTRGADFTALDNVDLTVNQGEFFALLGPSGCGKTTLMRLIAGFETPSEGRILLAGEDLAGTPPHKRPVNMMFQSYALFPHMNVEANVAFGLKQDGGHSKAEIRDRTADMLALVQLQDFAKRKPHQLSGGQRQRVALARSLAKGPKLLLLDEPLGALDRKLREATQFELMNIQEKLGVTFIIVTHDQEEAMTVADRIAVMNEGRFEQIGTPREVYERPKNRFVAGFVGDVNIIEDGEQTFALRPEKLRISKRTPARGMERRKGQVVDIAYSGSLTRYHVKLEDGTMMQAQEANALSETERAISWDDEVWLSWAGEAAVTLEG